MASTQHVQLSPAELAFLHESLAQTPPIRPDGRAATQFRPLRAETGMLPGTNGSARVCFADGTEAIVGVKAQVEASRHAEDEDEDEDEDDDAARLDGGDGDDDAPQRSGGATAPSSASSFWVEVTVEIPGVRDDETGTVFLAALLAEALLADGQLAQALRINRRFHWKLFLDVLLVSPPLSYPLPLLSLTTHLALLATRLPRLVSEGDEDPFFDDDWDAAPFLYARADRDAGDKAQPQRPQQGPKRPALHTPPITLLVLTVGDNILFDPTAEELAVAQAVLAVSVGRQGPGPTLPSSSDDNSTSKAKSKSTSKSKSKSSAPAKQQKPPRPSPFRLLAVRTIDPPSRLTAPGTPYRPEAAAAAAATTMPLSAASSTTPTAQQPAGQSDAAGPSSSSSRAPETEAVYGVWRAPRGGAKVALLAAMTRKVLEPGGVAEEVFSGLDGVAIV